MNLDKQFWSRAGMIVFLILLVMGFTIPSILNNGESNNNIPGIDPRICQTDADCYLLCDEGPKTVLCYQNLCQQNVCEELTYFTYQQAPIVFDLQISINGKNLVLDNRSKDGNIFVAFKEGKVNSFSPDISLNHVLDKINVKIDQNCLYLDAMNYCRDQQHELVVKINGNESFSYEDYVPKANDLIEIRYY